ncbi:ABC transporter B family member 6 [Hibiscus syriacus]|uniref:ABC transporter B family member 6 n=1 Tax=Hibiscus syriacus TaxID=106335 RepID=A0A6A2WFX9_HIBSY|nr:ABC transporter B family member 6 [Hibiscus syriacus]
MAALSSMYEKPSASNKVHLMRRLFNLRMAERASVAQHLNELNTITTQLSSVEIEFNDEVRALILLSSLPDSWNATVTAVSSSSRNSKLKFDDVRNLGHLSTPPHAKKSWRIMSVVILGRSEVRHIHGLKRNLISMGQLDGEGYSTTFSGCEWKITKRSLVIARGKKTGTLYVTSNLENIITAVESDGKSNLWHQRLDYMSEKWMKMLLSKGKLSDLKNVDVGLCEDCIFGKQQKVSFAKIGKTLKAKKLELVHTDVWGLSPVPSLAGSLYYVTFINDSMRNVWVYFLKKKSEVFDTFRKWKAMVENETGLKVKRLRSDNGGEYRNKRMNRTLNERARSMRIHFRLPKLLWAEAINTAAYLINCERSVPLDGGIPEEVWSNKEINLSHLRVFGCISYVHINSTKRSKLDAKSNKRVFVGYCGDEFGYWSTIESSSSNTEAETEEFAEFEEIFGNDVQISPEAVQEEPGTPELRCSSRIPKPTQHYSPSLHYLLLTENGELECYDEAMHVEHSVKWEYFMKDEMDSLMSNQTWELAELPPGKKTLHNKWIYRMKEEHDESKRYKVRFVVKGFQQKEGIDYNEIFSPVVKLSIIRLVLKIVAAENLHLEQLDVKTAFLHGDLEEEIYMRQPEGFIEASKKNLVCRLKKSLYGLKQAPRQWYKKFDSFMSSSGFTRCQADHCCYIKRFDNSFVFVMKDLGAAKQILGMMIKRDTKSETLMLSQAEYINKVLSRFNMQDAKPVNTPLGVHFRLSKEQSPKTEEECTHMMKVTYVSAIGSLMYVMVCTRPDIAHAVGDVSRYMNNPSGDTIITSYVDADLAGNVDIRRSTTWYVYTLGGTAVSWVFQLQKIVALSTTEAEYVAVTEASKEMVWLQSFLEELDKKQENNVLYCDSQSAIHLAKNPYFHSRTKERVMEMARYKEVMEIGWVVKYRKNGILSLTIVFIAAGVFASGWIEVSCWILTGERQTAVIRYVQLHVSSHAVSLRTLDIFSYPNIPTGPFIVAAGGISNIFLHRLAENIQDAYAEAASIAEQAVSYIRTLYAFTNETLAKYSYATSLQATLRYDILISIVQGLSLGFTYGLAICSCALQLWVGRFLVTHNKAHGGEIIAELFAVILSGLAVLLNQTILLLDEVTGGLDFEAERTVQEALDLLMLGRSTIIIARQLCLIRNVDYIAVMEEGQLVEMGTHDELLALDGLYAELLRCEEATKLPKRMPVGNYKETSTFQIEKDSSSVKSVQESLSPNPPPEKMLENGLPVDASGKEPSIRRQDSFERRLPEMLKLDVQLLVSLSHSDDIPMKVKEAKGVHHGKAPSFWKLAQLSFAEWLYAVLGSIGAAIFGSFNLLLAYVIALIVTAYYRHENHHLQNDVDRWCLIIVCMGIVTVVANFLQHFYFGIIGEKMT